MTDDQRPNTLGLREKDLDNLIAQIDRDCDGNKTGGAANRVFSRWKFRHQSLAVRILQPGGTEIETRMACRNLSKGGVGLLHRSYVHIGTTCVLKIPHPSKGEIEVRGRIIRCLHHSGMVHEIGVRFEQEIPLREIMKPDPMQEMYAVEQIDPTLLVGTILLVEDSDMDVKLVKHFLRDTQIRVKHTTSVNEAEQLAKSGVGLVLCDIHLGEENGGDLARRLREHATCAPPVVMISADRADSTYRLVSQPFVKGFLAKPFSQDSLIRTVCEFMVDPAHVQAAADATSVKADPQIVAVLMPELMKACEKLSEAAKEEDPTLALSIVMQIAGVAPVLGLDELSGIAEAMGQKLAQTMDLEWVTSRMDEITRLCTQAASR